jgi:hypothetical protein
MENQQLNPKIDPRQQKGSPQQPRELRQIVQSADPERQDELKELASTLLEQELTPIRTSERTTGVRCDVP